MKHNWHSAQLAASPLFVLAIQRQVCQASIWEVPISVFAHACQWTSNITCMPSWPEIPTPTSATWIILTSLAPSPEDDKIQFYLSQVGQEIAKQMKTSCYYVLAEYRKGVVGLKKKASFGT